MSEGGVRLDANGNVDTTHLQRELNSALEFDILYKKRDNMKKKAVKISKDYEEFKNYVACAHLKTLSRKEVESLAATKKGWQKKSTIQKNSAQILLDESKNDALFESGASIEISYRRPKTTSEVDRDWRRLPDGDRIKYLIQVGLKRLQKLFTIDMDVTLLEGIIVVLLTEAEKVNATSSILNPEAAEEVLEVESFINRTSLICDWFHAIPSFRSFSLNICFINNDNISNCQLATCKLFSRRRHPGCTL